MISINAKIYKYVFIFHLCFLIKVKIQVRKLGKTDSVILDYNFRDLYENKLYKSVIDQKPFFRQIRY